ncbi:hypothetical protein MLD38_021149 [Melastoma candidum]|uniref:Uncharacterized protein n=1 Tax=Melastoma candidum TaxID=119954 RepID=A0ACB9QG44_9MYRT|nr:hypothetical protein MLD38_021149 [Melastoma candidum]
MNNLIPLKASASTFSLPATLIALVQLGLGHASDGLPLPAESQSESLDGPSLAAESDDLRARQKLNLKRVSESWMTRRCVLRSVRTSLMNCRRNQIPWGDLCDQGENKIEKQCPNCRRSYTLF